MDKFTEALTEGLRRFALAGMGAISLTIDKSKKIIDKLVERGEITAAEGKVVCDELQKKMAAQLEAFSQKLKSDYENASFDQMLSRCDSLTPEQKAILIERLSTPPEEIIISDADITDKNDDSTDDAPTTEENIPEEPDVSPANEADTGSSSTPDAME